MVLLLQIGLEHIFFVSEKQCCLHIGNSHSKESKMIFTEETLQNCHAKKAIRDKSKARKSKFDSIVLPTEPNGIDGYHASCYRYFCAVKAKDRKSISRRNSISNQSEINYNYFVFLVPAPPTIDDVCVDFEASSNDAIKRNYWFMTNEFKENHNRIVIPETNADSDEEWMDDLEASTCIFCDRVRRKRNGVYQYPLKTVSPSKKSRIREILSVEGYEKLSEIQDAVSINFHVSCLSEYEHKLFYTDRMLKRKGACSRNNWVNRRQVHEKSFANILNIVTEKLVDGRQVHALRNVYQHYLCLCAEYSTAGEPSQSNHTSYSKKHFCDRLLKKLPVLSKSVFKNQTFLHRNDLSVSELLSTAFHAEEALSQIKSVAFGIRKAIMKQTKRTLPKHNISIEDIFEGECDVPADLYTLINCIVKGPRDPNNEIRDIKIKSICDSIIYSASCGAIKPSTSLSLALVTKSMTGSRKIVEILNRLGHCVNYTCVEELESEIAYGGAASTKILPYGLVPKNPQLRTHVAFDNFDRFVETSSGKDTLHDTVGIVYQNNVPTDVTDIGTVMRTTEVDHQRRRRGYHSALDSEIVPFVRKPKNLPNLVGNSQMIPENLHVAVNLNALWMLFHALDIDGATRWFEWNSERIVDTNPIQKIGYLPNLNASPTSDSVVMKTLEMAIEIADECQQKHIIVTYDLAIACRAYKIRAEMAPRFDRTFIALGSFHTELSFFKV